MSKFDEILDDVIYKAKVAADVAGKKTNEVVEFGKLKYKAKQVSWDIEKAYAKLGALVYEARKSDESFDEIIMLAVEELDKLNERLDRLEDKLAYMKTDDYKNQREAARTARGDDAAPEADKADDSAPDEVIFGKPEDDGNDGN
ncbi:MAG: hypothetical protein LBV27_09990 [Oscillospiraceae bacterium]|nr:hypothetical protein [Oscillospiraceae bacterium]